MVMIKNTGNASFRSRGRQNIVYSKGSTIEKDAGCVWALPEWVSKRLPGCQEYPNITNTQNQSFDGKNVKNQQTKDIVG